MLRFVFFLPLIGEIYCATCTPSQGPLTVGGGDIADCIAGKNSTVSLVVESGVTGIPATGCYNWANLVNISLPSSLTTIGYNAFRNCSKLESVMFGASTAISLGSDIFYECTALTNVSFLTGFGPSIGNSMFFYCPKLKNVNIPSSVSSIGDAAFYITGLMHLSVPWGMSSLGIMAFQECPELVSVSFGESLRFVEDYAFQNKCQSYIHDISFAAGR
jgi:hypothetical protein